VARPRRPAAGAGRIVVVDSPRRALEGVLPEGVETVVQERPLGTGDAVKAAAAHVDPGAPVVVLYGDVPLITAEAIAALAGAHEATGAAATVATMVLEDPTGYGRVVRGADGTVERVVETKVAGDATPEELELREVNTGIYAFGGADLLAALDAIEPANAQGEYYLPDVLPVLRERGRPIAAHVIDDHTLTLGINDRVDLARVRALAQARIHEAHARAGVTIVDPASTLIEAGVTIGRDTIVEPSTFLRGDTAIGERCLVGPLTTIIDSTLADEVSVPHSYLTGARLAAGASVGPFAYLRPGAELAEKAKAGTFVEIKNSRIGAGAKVPHLSYIGDADVGEGTNLGAATITANYDGREKHRTTIGAGGARLGGHHARGPRDGGRRGVHGRGLGDHRGRAARRAGDRPRPPAQRRGLRGPPRARERHRTVHPPRTLPPVSALDPSPAASSSLQLGYDKKLMLFSGRANPALANRIAGKLNVDLGGVTLKTFDDGEVYCRYEESIRGADVFIVQPTCGNADTGVTPNDALMELLLMIDAAVGASAHRVIAVTPWFGYSRQDKKSAPREPISARLVARALESAGADRVLTMDLHAGQIQGFFQKPVDHMTALFMLTQYFADMQLEDLVVVSPDAGRVKLAKNFASKIGAELAILNKERPAQQVAEIGYVIGDVQGRNAILVDDMIGTAGTLMAAARTVMDEGASRVFAAATHGIFSGRAYDNLANSPFEQIVVTDTIPLRAGAPGKIQVLSCADLLTDSIRRIFTDDSVSEVFGGENQLF
jgi:ribose-phosphate pyrophosphokinase